MSKGDKTLKYENVNGVMLSLRVDGRNSSPKSRQFTISYSSSNEERKSNWSMISLLVAILANIVFLIYVRINLTILVVIVTVLSFIVFFWVTHSVQSETLLVIPTVGIQSSVQYVVGREDNFVPWTKIDDIIINEAIKLNRVLYFLTLLVKINSDYEPLKLIPLFKYTKPRLLMLESIYKEIQDLLTEQAMGAGDIGG
ncbi:phosphatidylinositol N-acetylglucosaminyltransferase subunit H-like [Cydia strobilella]|uniref:phosphatidylinositol N-acetylglucosaminyltransferase subunit H-like n=1 Tax=Cydia strobilella TaxID=1100964 RepID=UPI0030049235